jgi:transposase
MNTPKPNTRLSEITQNYGHHPLDLGDKRHHSCLLDAAGRVVKEGTIPATGRGLERLLGSCAPMRVVIEAGTHSPWVSRRLAQWGHQVLVANPRKLRAISSSLVKSDQRDAHMLARLGRFDPELLSPIRHRGARAQAHLAVLRSRDALVRARSALINHARGTVKALGERLPSCSAEAFHRRAAAALPEELGPALEPVLAQIEQLTAQIRAMERTIAQVGAAEYPETRTLQAIRGVGPITALAFVLTLEEPTRFERSRSVPAYLGLVPRHDESGQIDKQLRITRAGNGYLRRLLVSCAHYVLGPFGEPSALRAWGQKLGARGGKNARKRAVVAVARKLAVLLHVLWKGEAAYEPWHRSGRPGRAGARARAA